jgi:hypothetical protein
MVLFEIYSNVAGTDQGLRDFPACMDLADMLRAMGVQARFIRQVHRETDEINLAQGQFGQGVRVRGTALKSHRPETHIKGCVAWSRAILGRVERALHLEVSQVRATNGAPLVMGMLFRRGHYAFVSGIDGVQFSRLKAEPDLSFTRIPVALVGQVGALEDYLARRQRQAGFFSQAQEVAALECLPPARRNKLAEIARTRDGAALGALSDAEVVNVGLISEFIDRYQSIFEQFAGMLRQAELGAELGAHFDMLTQGVPYPELRATLEPFTQEHTRHRITDTRSLANELRIALTNADERARQEFHSALRSVTLKHRMMLDPACYQRCTLLPDARVEDVEVLAPVRDMWAGLKGAMDAVRDAMRESGSKATQSAPVPLKQMLFEVLLRLTFDAQFSNRLDEAHLPPSAQTARRLLEGIHLAVYDLANLRKINPKLPPRGVAANLADKIPIVWTELERVLAQLSRQLFPLGALAQEMARTLRTRLREKEAARQAEMVRQYLHRGGVLLGLTNFVLGRARLTSEEWAALLEAGRTLGLPMLSSRDQIRNASALRQIQEGLDDRLEGYVLLLSREQAQLFPVRAEPSVLAAAYAHLVETQAVRLVRRFFFQKVQVLTKQYGKEMFEILYRQVTRQGGLAMSRRQLGGILIRHRVFDPVRLRELGFASASLEEGDAGSNPWLAAVGAPEEGQEARHLFSAERVAEAYQAALSAFREHVSGYRAVGDESGGASAGRPLEAALAALVEEELFDPRLPAARGLLAQTAAAAQLWKVAQQAISQNFKTVLADAGSAQEAIEITLPGRLALLAYLKPSHTFKAGEHSLLFRLVPDPDAVPESLPAGPAAVVQALAAAVQNGNGASPLGRAVGLLERHLMRWEELRQVAMVPLIDQILQETLLKLVQPMPPGPEDVPKLPEERVLCIGVSSVDQGKFHRLVPRIDKPEVYATLSELASWLARFPRLEDELETYRSLIEDIVKVVESMNFTVWDAPYLIKYRESMEKLRETLAIRPEHITRQDLLRIEEQARELGRMVRDIHAQEQALRPRDRWLNRIATRLRAMRPQASLTFVDRLCEGAERAQAVESGGEAPGSKDAKEFQTFSERVRNVIDCREKLEGKQVFALSPANTQRALTLNLIDRIFALKGLATPVLVDVSGCESFVPALRSRLPPHRLFNLNAL